MGVPVVSLLGDRHASRVGASILSRVGLAEFIADSVDGYVASATMLGNSLGRLATLRRELRDTMAASPLCNAAGFTFDIESVYRAVWRRWCDGA